LGFDLKTHKAELFDGGNVPFGATNMRTIGRALFLLLTSPSVLEEARNKYIHIASHMTTQLEILAVLEKVTGKTWERTSVSGKELSQTSLDRFQKGDSEALPGIIQAMTWGKLGDDNLGDFSGEPLFNEKLGLPHEDIEAVVTDVLSGKAP
jgi:hypothetical protein